MGGALQREESGVRLSEGSGGSGIARARGREVDLSRGGGAAAVEGPRGLRRGVTYLPEAAVREGGGVR